MVLSFYKRVLARVLDRIIMVSLWGTAEELLRVQRFRECKSDLQRTGEGFSACLSDILFLPLINGSPLYSTGRSPLLIWWWWGEMSWQSWSACWLMARIPSCRACWWVSCPHGSAGELYKPFWLCANLVWSAVDIMRKISRRYGFCVSSSGGKFKSSTTECFPVSDGSK